MSDPKCARALLEAADRDILTLRKMTARVPDESFGFHVQQAAEKAFKAWLCALGQVYPLRHDLDDLLDTFEIGWQRWSDTDQAHHPQLQAIRTGMKRS